MLKKFVMDRNRSSCQKIAWAAGQMAAFQEGFIVYSNLSPISEPMGLKRDRKIDKNLAWPDLRSLII